MPDNTTSRPDQPRSERSTLHPVVDGILLADAVAWIIAGTLCVVAAIRRAPGVSAAAAVALLGAIGLFTLYRRRRRAAEARGPATEAARRQAGGSRGA